jgi:cytochrome c biogenesis protein CcmG, thiol:disulfide interchange protein DsbE
MSKKIPWKIVLWALAAIVVAAAALRRRAPHPVEIGEEAPAFVLPAPDAGGVSLANYRGQVVLVNFWATWCPPCVEETPSLEKFASQLKDQGVTVIGVSVDESDSDLRKFIAAYHLSYPIARDPGGSLANRYGTFKYPETYILDREGRVAEKIIGPADWVDPRMINFVKDLAGRAQTASR